MFRVKICGITSLTDLDMVHRLGADAVGFNFYRKSSRYIDPETCRGILDIFGGTIKVIGVFVNEREEVIRQVADLLDLDAVQLSGDREIEDSIVVHRPAIRVLRPVGPADILDAIEDPHDWIMFDSKSPGLYGGTGRPMDFSLLENKPLPRDFLLAGGLDPENVKEAVLRSQPYGVDVASGVEEYPGKKDPLKVKKFIDRSREVLAVE